MSSRKFAAIFFCIFLLGAFPLVMVQSYGAMSASISAGFAAFLQQPSGIILFLLCGLAAVLCGVGAILFLPLSATLLFVIGGGIEIGTPRFEYLKLLILAWVILFAFAAHLLHGNRRFLTFAVAFGIFAFAFGGSYVAQAPEVIVPAPFLVGIGIGSLLIAGIGISIGVTINEFMQRAVEKLKAAPATSFLTWIL